MKFKIESISNKSHSQRRIVTNTTVGDDDDGVVIIFPTFLSFRVRKCYAQSLLVHFILIFYRNHYCLQLLLFF